MEDNERRERREKKKKLHQRIFLIIAGSILIVLSIAFVAVEMFEPPLLSETYVEFKNGTKTWIHTEDVESIQEQLIPNYEDFMKKITNLNDGTVDYKFKHVDAIGAKPKLP